MAVHYDDVAGTVTVVEDFYDAGYWHDQLSGTPEEFQWASVGLGSACSGYDNNELGVNFEYADSNPELPNGGLPTSGYFAEATLMGYEGIDTGTLAFDGTNWAGTVTNSAFAGQDWRCAIVDPYDDDTSTGIQGRQTLPLTAPESSPPASTPATLPGRYVIVGAYYRQHPSVLPVNVNATSEKLRWRHWGAQTATATGQLFYATPANQTGTVPVTVALFGSMVCARHVVYAKLTVSAVHAADRRRIAFATGTTRFACP